MGKLIQTDIAKHLNISRTTVSRVLNNSNKVKPETRERVMAALQAMEYEPNLYASNLALKSAKNCGFFLVESTVEEVNHDLERGIQKALAEYSASNINVEIFWTKSTEIQQQREQILSYVQSNPDIVVVDTLSEAALLTIVPTLQEKNILLFTLNADVLTNYRKVFIGSDHYLCGRVAADLLLKKAGTKGDFVVFQMEDDYASCIIRQDGFFSVCKEHSTLNVRTITLKHPEEAFESTIKHIDLLKKANGVYSLVELADTIDALSSKNISCHFASVGSFTSNRGLHHVEQGKIDYLLYQREELQGYKMMKAVHNCLFFKTKPFEFDFVGLDIITKENKMKSLL